MYGVTGVGKSFYKDLIRKELGFEKIKIITTREIRKGEKNNDDKIFITPEKLDEMIKGGKIAYKFDMLGNTYAYTYEALFSNKNTVFEMHYPCIFDFKKICPDIKTIYLLPENIEIPKQKLKDRNLNPKIEKQRLQEIDEHYNRYMTDENLRKQFDFVVINKYNEDSKKEIIYLVKKELEKQN